MKDRKVKKGLDFEYFEFVRYWLLELIQLLLIMAYCFDKGSKLVISKGYRSTDLVALSEQ